MARPRVPRVYGIIQCVFRLLSLGSVIGELAILIRLSVKYRKTYGTAIAAVIAALIFDGTEAVALLDASRTIPRVAPPCVAVTDVLILALACGSVLEILFSDWGLGDDPNRPINGYPWMDSEDVALWYMVTIIGLRFIFCVWGCVDCCCIFRKKPRRPIDRVQANGVENGVPLDPIDIPYKKEGPKDNAK